MEFSGSERTALETQLKHARNQINLELERRLTAERARDSLERQVTVKQNGEKMGLNLDSVF
jgi:hypothetical protein